MSTREAILDAAARLFGEVGYEAASTRRIGELSGINKALIHYHFADKGDLWKHVIERYYGRLGAALRPVTEREAPLRDRLVELVTTYLDFLAANREFACMVQREISGGRHVQAITAQMVPLFERGAALLQRSYPETRRGALSADQLLLSFFGMAVSSVTYAPVVEGLVGFEPLSPRALALRKAHLVEMADLVIQALESRNDARKRRPAGTARNPGKPKRRPA